MKRIGYLFDKICDKENILQAHYKASKGKNYYTEIKNVNSNLEYYIDKIQDMLKNNTYTLSKQDYSLEIINDKGKERELYKLKYFPHRIIQWAIMNILMDIFMKNFISHTYASLKNKGIHSIVKDVSKILKNDKNNTLYCYKFDIKKFYPNINNKILMRKLEEKFKDKKLLNLFNIIIFSMGDRGLPIGSLLSQYLANFYLSSFDHYCKEKLKIKYYFRYMDDIVIIAKDKLYLHKINILLHEILKKDFDLSIKENWQIFPIDIRGIDFVGYRLFHNKTILRKNIYKKVRYVFSKNKYHKSVPSYYGWCKHANIKNFMKKHDMLNWRFKCSV